MVAFFSASYTNWKRINKLQTSYLRSIMEYAGSTRGPAIEVEVTCPPFNVRYCWLAGKIILKSLAQTNYDIFDTYSLFLTWRYTPKTMPVLSIAANFPSNYHQYIIKSNKPQLYEQSFDSLPNVPLVQTNNYFSHLSSNDFKIMSPLWSTHLF